MGKAEKLSKLFNKIIKKRFNKTSYITLNGREIELPENGQSYIEIPVELAAGPNEIKVELNGRSGIEVHIEVYGPSMGDILL